MAAAGSKTIPAQEVGTFNVRTASDEATPDIVGGVFLPDGGVLLSDLANQKLKVMDAASSVTREFRLDGDPCKVCMVAPGEVCVALIGREEVAFVKVGAGVLETTRSFPVGAACRGVAAAGDRLYVSCGGGLPAEGPAQVRVFTMTGEFIRSWQSPLCSSTDIVTNTAGTKIHVADGDNGVITFNGHGDMLWAFYESSAFDCCYGICIATDESLYVCGQNSNTVVHLSATGELLRTFLVKDGIWGAQMLCYHPNGRRLLVGMSELELVKVLQL